MIAASARFGVDFSELLVYLIHPASMLHVSVTERLLLIAVISLVAVYWFYWAARRETDSTTSTALVVKRLRPLEVKEHLPRPETPPCSFQTFRAIARQRADGYVPGSGTWTRNGTQIERFQPSICRLTHGQWIPEDELATCLRRDRVRYVAIVADSNGRGYLYNLRRLLSQAPRTTAQRQRISCGPIYRYIRLEYNSYRHPQVLVKHRCPCGGYCTLEFSDDTRDVHCDVQQVRCTVDDDTDVLLEYITAWFTIDPKVQYDTSRTGCQRSSSSPVEPSRANTTQAFLLGEYLTSPRPDVLLVFSNTHDDQPLSEHADNVDQLTRLIDQLVPTSTRLVWASRHAEDERKKPAGWQHKYYVQEDGRRLTRLDWLDEANRILYAKLRQRFVDGRRPTIMFPDLLAMSQLALDDLNKDGVHMYDVWYQTVISFILQSLCQQSSTR